MLIYTIRRWNGNNPNNEITNRFDISDGDWTLNLDYSANTTSSFKVTNTGEIRESILSGDFVYVPEFQWIGMVKEYNKDSHEITVGDIFNAYQFPVAVYSDAHFNDGVGTILQYLQDISKSGKYPELKMDMFDWSFDPTGNTSVDVSFGQSQGGMEIIEFHDFVWKMIVKMRSTTGTAPNQVVKGIRWFVDNIDTSGTTNHGLKINMRLGVTKTAGPGKFAWSEDLDKHRFIQNLEIEDKRLTKNSVILYNDLGAVRAQYYIDMTYSGVTTNRPDSSKWPIYVGGYLVKDEDLTKEDAPTLAQIAAAQLPVNQSSNFKFDVSQYQDYIDWQDIQPGTIIEMSIVKGTLETRKIQGMVTKLEITSETMHVEVGLDKPRLTLTL